MTRLRSRGPSWAKAPSEEKSTAKRFVGAPEGKSYRSSFDDYLKYGRQADELIEHKADLAEGASATGGYLVPADYNDRLISTIAAAAPMFQLANSVQTTSDLFHAPNVASIGAAGWTAEASAFTTGDDTFGDTPITVFKCSRITKVSEELLQDNAFDMESWLSESFGRAFGALINSALTVGTGGVQPFGIVTRGTAVTTTGEQPRSRRGPQTTCTTCTQRWLPSTVKVQAGRCQT